jgi:hypothetical protein
MTDDPRERDDAAHLSQEIEATRRRIADTLGALEHRLSARRIGHELIDGLRDTLMTPQDGSHPMIDTLKRNPIPAALIGVGIGWLCLAGARPDASPAAPRSNGPASTRGGDPLLLGALGLAAGALLGALLPMTRREGEWLGDAHDRLAGEADALARTALERAWAAAEHAGRAAIDAVVQDLGDIAPAPRSNGADGQPH